jgi:hypothetical protein
MLAIMSEMKTLKVRAVRIAANRQNGNPHAARAVGLRPFACLDSPACAAYAPKFINSLKVDGCSVTLARSAIQAIA